MDKPTFRIAPYSGTTLTSETAFTDSDLNVFPADGTLQYVSEHDSDYRPGDRIVFHGTRKRWWVRLWRWMTRQEDAYTVENATTTTFTIRP